MPDVLILRFDAPLLSFGGVTVDSHGVTREFPSLSMLTGMLGNALGLDHRDADQLGALQARIRHAARRDRAGAKLRDYQTVDLGQRHLVEKGWTTRNAAEGRTGGDAREGTHIRERDYWADAVYTVALRLEPAEVAPTLDELERALREPERPLFIGRKPCLPAAPILVGRIQAPSLFAALEATPRLPRTRWAEPDCAPEPLAAWIPGEEQPPGPSRELPVTDERDWENQIVVGRRIVKQVLVNPPEASHGC